MALPRNRNHTQPQTVPRIPQNPNREHRYFKTVACLLLGGRTQHATTAMSFEIAASHAAHLTAIAPIDPFTPSPRSSLGHSMWPLVDDVDFAAMRDAARSAVEEFETQSRDNVLKVSRIIGGSDVRTVAAEAAKFDLVLVPANAGVDGTWTEARGEVAEFLVRRGHTAILRVSRRPLDVKNIVLVTSSTGRCSGLAHRYLELDLWPEAKISFLPIGAYRPCVSQYVSEQLDLLQTRGRQATLLPPIDLDFEAIDLQHIVSPFQVAVMGHLTHRAGWFDSVRCDPFEVVASCIPVALLP